jgi:hypothetical protein
MLKLAKPSAKKKKKHNIVDEEMSFTQVRLDSILPGCGKMDTSGENGIQPDLSK